MCLASGILQKGSKLPCPVDASGMFTSDVPDFKGQHVKVTELANKPVNISKSALWVVKLRKIVFLINNFYLLEIMIQVCISKLLH